MQTVLLVDDDACIRKSVGDMLARSGYEVKTAADGATALTVLQDSPTVDLVIVDYRMPGMDGIALVRRIREMHAQLPVVIMTGHGDLESYLCATSLGVARYIGKPVGLRELQRALRAVAAERTCDRTMRRIPTG